MTPEHFKQIRLSMGPDGSKLSQTELAEWIGYSSASGPRNVQRFEAGDTIPPWIDKLMRYREKHGDIDV